jgi:moderate conductance mechanosensitive channel
MFSNGGQATSATPLSEVTRVSAARSLISLKALLAQATAGSTAAAPEKSVHRIDSIGQALTEMLSAYIPPVVSMIIIKVVLIALVIVAAWLALKVARALIKGIALSVLEARMGPKSMARARMLTNLFYGIAKYVIFFFAFIVALPVTGIDPAPFLGGAAIIGLAVSFGSQDLVKDVMTGAFVMAENQFTIGEYVEVGGKAGVVVGMSVRIVTIRDAQGNLHSVPYRNITIATNASRAAAPVVMDIFLTSTADEARAPKVVEETLSVLSHELSPIVRSYKVVGVINPGTPFAAVRADIECRPNRSDFVQTEATSRIKRAFAAASIAILEDRIRFFGRPLTAVPTLDDSEMAGDDEGIT